MIVKKLRRENHWSQEELAEMCGLNVRTVQRVENGQKASLETLRSLASVLEVDISELMEEITLIDKASEKWRKLPWWFKSQMNGIRNRKMMVYFELLWFLVGITAWLVRPDHVAGPILIVSAYISVWLERYGDKKKIW